MIPEVDLARVRKWIEARNANMPEHARGEIRYELDVTDRTVTILECRPPWRPAYSPEWTRSPVARLRYTKSRAEWSLYWADHSFRFHLYDPISPTPHIDELIVEIDDGPTSIFWG